MASLTSVGRKKLLEQPVPSRPQPSNKKRKVCFNLLDQSMEQLGDVPFVSGVNIKEEEEQLFSGSNFKASLKSEYVEEQKLILNKTLLLNKLAEIMTKFGLKNKGDNVEQCLSLIVEERLRGLIDNLIRFSKQRIDGDKSRHNAVKLQIMALNQKAKDETEEKLAEQEKIPKMIEKKGKDEEMRQLAANIASRVTVKDIVSLLETEPHMCKSAFMYRLFEKTRSTAAKKTEKM